MKAPHKTLVIQRSTPECTNFKVSYTEPPLAPVMLTIPCVAIIQAFYPR